MAKAAKPTPETNEEIRDDRFTSGAGEFEFYDLEGNRQYPEGSNMHGKPDDIEEPEDEDSDDVGEDEEDDEEAGEDESPEALAATNYGGAPGEHTHVGDPVHEE